jgi:hypothetical protein
MTLLMAASSRGLVLLDRANKLLSQASSLDDLKEVRDVAEAARGFARAAKLGLELQNRAAELKLRAERKAGAFLTDLRLKGGNRRSKGQRAPLKLEDLGLSKDQSKRWQLAATVPDEDFELYIRGTYQLGRELTAAGLLRIANSLRQQKSAGKPIHSNCPAPAIRDAVRGDRAELLALVIELKSQCEHLSELLKPLTAGEETGYRLAERRFIGRLGREITHGIKALEQHLWKSG